MQFVLLFLFVCLFPFVLFMFDVFLIDVFKHFSLLGSKRNYGAQNTS